MAENCTWLTGDNPDWESHFAVSWRDYAVASFLGILVFIGVLGHGIMLFLLQRDKRLICVNCLLRIKKSLNKIVVSKKRFSIVVIDF